MLIGFKIKNYRSFNDLQHFTMLAGKVRNNENHIVNIGKHKVLKFSGMFGANGSGKSNLILAMSFVQTLINNGVESIIDNQYFRGNKGNPENDSYFEYEISLNNKLYSYGFEINISKKMIVSEWLIDMTKPTEKVIFERDVKKGTINTDLKSKNDYFNICLLEMKKNTSELFIKEMFRRIAMSNNQDPFFDDIKNVFKFLVYDTIIIRPSAHKLFDIDYVKKKEKILKILGALDINIVDIVPEECDIKKVENKLPPEVFNDIKRNFELLSQKSKNANLTLRIENDLYIINKDSSNAYNVQSLKFIHSNNDETFGAFDESDGTIRILELIDILISHNKLFLIDELDSSLHPALVDGLLKIFLQSNSDNQLIITTHELKTLDFDLVRRDEIWFAEKNECGESRIYSLEEFKDVARFDRKIDKAYMEGRFGAIANIDVNYEN